MLVSLRKSEIGLWKTLAVFAIIVEAFFGFDLANTEIFSLCYTRARLKFCAYGPGGTLAYHR